MLADALHDEIVSLRRVRAEAADVRKRFGDLSESPPIYDLRAVASILTDIYQGAENVFEHIAETTGEGVPSGSEWHKKLLDQMEREAPGARPASIHAETRAALESFRKFRHRARHVYGFDLKWNRMKPLLVVAEETVDLIIADLDTFCQWLDALGDDEA